MITNKVILYLRVSTKEQVQGSSLETQEDSCRRYARDNGYEIVRVFIEKGESAKTADRTELKFLLEYVAKNKDIFGVIVWKIDRLARNTLDHASLKMFFNKYNVRLISATENLEDTSVGRLIENQLAGFAQFDNDVRAERSKNGMEAAMKAGRYVWMAPKGYVNTGGKGKSNLALDKPELVKKVHLIWELIDTGYSQEDARKEIAGKGLKISKSQFNRMLRNKTYMGVIEKFGLSAIGDFEPLVESALFLRVQDKLDRKARKIPIYRVDNPDFPLRNFIVCTYCSDGLTGSWSRGNGGKYAYYRCKNCKRINYKKDGDDGLETKFKEYLQNYHYKEELKELMLKAIEVNWEDRNKNNEKRVREIDSEISKLKILNKEIVGKNLGNVISDQLAKEMTTENEQKIIELELQLHSKQTTVDGVMTIAKRSISVLEDISGVWLRIDLDIKKRFQTFLFPQRLPFDGANFRTAQTAYCISQNVLSLPQNSSNVPSTGIEPTSPASEASALSIKLRGQLKILNKK